MSILKSYNKIDLLMMSFDNRSLVKTYNLSDLKKINPTLPILAHTSSETIRPDSFLEMGFDEVIQIPPKEDEFLNKIASHLALKYV